MECINFEHLLEQSKKRNALEFKQIKKLSLYNYINDGINTTIIDCRKDLIELQSKEGGYLQDINIYKYGIESNTDKLNIKTGSNSRLILIFDEDQILQSSQELFSLKDYIRKEDKIDRGIFIIKNSSYQEFLSEYNFFLKSPTTTDMLEIQLASTTFPLMIIDKFIYLGNILNSKNLNQLNKLKIKSIFSFLSEEDRDLSRVFANYHIFPVNEQNHSEIEFSEVIDLIDTEKDVNSPILIYCFSGQSVSPAVCIAYLMKFKKWSLVFSTAYVMKICPNFKVPSWLYTQLQRIDIKKLLNK